MLKNGLGAGRSTPGFYLTGWILKQDGPILETSSALASAPWQVPLPREPVGLSVDTKNAFNNGIGSANVGGFWGPELKFAGFDNLIVSGKAGKPVYLWIHDGKIEIRDAAFIWGKTT